MSKDQIDQLKKLIADAPTGAASDELMQQLKDIAETLNFNCVDIQASSYTELLEKLAHTAIKTLFHDVFINAVMADKPLSAEQKDIIISKHAAQFGMRVLGYSVYLLFSHFSVLPKEALDAGEKAITRDAIATIKASRAEAEKDNA